MPTFTELVESRKSWIREVLEPWCRKAPVAELRKAAAEWLDIAGKADAEATLWTWAWSRFPGLIYEGLSGINETVAVRVELTDGRVLEGYPNARAGQPWELTIITADGTESELVSLDEVVSVAPFAE